MRKPAQHLGIALSGGELETPETLLRNADAGARSREAAKVVAELTGLRVNDLYQP